MKKLYLNDRLFQGTEKEFLAVEKFRSKKWEFNGVIHRDDNPAVVYSG